MGSGFAKGNYYCNKDTYEHLDLYNTNLISSRPKLTPTPTMIRSGTRFLAEVDRAKAPAVEAVMIAVTVAETTQLHINIHLKRK